MTRKPSKQRGRPVVDEADRRDKHVRVLTTKAEHKELQEAAASVKMSISAWLRALALERARAMVAVKKRARTANPATHSM